MRKSTELNLSIDGFNRGTMAYPRIDGIKSIDYDYDTYYKLAKIDLNCDSKICDLAGMMKAIITNVPSDSREIRVNLNYRNPVALRC